MYNYLISYQCFSSVCCKQPEEQEGLQEAGGQEGRRAGGQEGRRGCRMAGGQEGLQITNLELTLYNLTKKWAYVFFMLKLGNASGFLAYIYTKIKLFFGAL